MKRIIFAVLVAVVALFSAACSGGTTKAAPAVEHCGTATAPATGWELPAYRIGAGGSCRFAKEAISLLDEAAEAAGAPFITTPKVIILWGEGTAMCDNLRLDGHQSTPTPQEDLAHACPNEGYVLVKGAPLYEMHSKNVERFGTVAQAYLEYQVRLEVKDDWTPARTCRLARLLKQLVDHGSLERQQALGIGAPQDDVRTTMTVADVLFGGTCQA